MVVIFEKVLELHHIGVMQVLVDLDLVEQLLSCPLFSNGFLGNEFGSIH